MDLKSYTTRTIRVEAVQLTEENVGEVAKLLSSVTTIQDKKGRVANFGDWIVTDGKEFHVYSDGEFQIAFESFKPAGTFQETDDYIRRIIREEIKAFLEPTMGEKVTTRAYNRCQKCGEYVSQGQKPHHYKYCEG